MARSRQSVFEGKQLKQKSLAESTIPGNEQRFLREIVARIPVSSVVELHLFSPRRMGGMESGVAVVAVEVASEAAESGSEPDEGAYAAEDAPAEDRGAGAAVADADGAPAAGADEEAADASVADEEGALATFADAEGAQGASVRREPVRYSVHTARYRHTFKGVERGKWEFELVLEADAPLVEVDRVVNGVVQRSGDQGEPVRLSGAELGAAIGGADWTGTT